MSKLFYFDHASTTKTSPEVNSAILNALENHWENPSSIYTSGYESKLVIDKAKKDIANELNCSPTEIYFTSGGSEANSWALKQGTEIYTTTIEHDSILNNPLVQKLAVDSDGTVGIKKIDYLLEGRDPDLISTMWVNNEIGAINDVENIGNLVQSYHSALYHVDAVQALGNVVIDLKKLPVNLMSFSGHKINAPKGIGVLYIKNAIPKPIPMIYGGKQESGVRGGTENITGIVGFAEAIKGINSKVSIKNQKYSEFNEVLLRILTENNVDFINNSKGIPAITSLSFRGIEGEALMFLLDLDGICVSTGSACTSGTVKTSHVLREINCPKEYISGTIRISYGLENTIDEVIFLASNIVKNYNKLKNLNGGM